MSEPAVCRHCGYFLDYRIPKAPGEPSWAHTLQTPTKPTGPPCDTPEPRAVNPADPRPATDGPVEWDWAAPRRPSDLPEFLLARFAEDEAAARLAMTDGGWPTDGAPGPVWTTEAHAVGDGQWFQETIKADQPWALADVMAGQCAPHIARWDPARVLAECEAKRRIVEIASADWVPDTVLSALALPYADHPDYREEWR